VEDGGWGIEDGELSESRLNVSEALADGYYIGPKIGGFFPAGFNPPYILYQGMEIKLRYAATLFD
jgi:hypothetical protein